MTRGRLEDRLAPLGEALRTCSRPLRVCSTPTTRLRILLPPSETPTPSPLRTSALLRRPSLPKDDELEEQRRVGGCPERTRLLDIATDRVNRPITRPLSISSPSQPLTTAPLLLRRLASAVCSGLLETATWRPSLEGRRVRPPEVSSRRSHSGRSRPVCGSTVNPSLVHPRHLVACDYRPIRRCSRRPPALGSARRPTPSLSASRKTSRRILPTSHRPLERAVRRPSTGQLLLRAGLGVLT